MLMNKHGIEYNEKHLSGDGLQRFKDVTKLNTLPQIYDEKDNHIGGYQELLAHLENLGVASPARLELATYGLEDRCSNPTELRRVSTHHRKNV